MLDQYSNFRRIRSPTLHNLDPKQYVPQKPSESKQATHFRNRVYSTSLLQIDQISHNLKPPDPNPYQKKSNSALKVLFSPDKTQSWNPSPTDKEILDRNSHELSEITTDLNLLSPTPVLIQEKIKTPEQRSLNDLDFDASFGSEEDSKQNAAKFPTNNNIKPHSKSSLNNLPKTISTLDPGFKPLKQSTYWDFSHPRRYNFYWYKPEQNDSDLRPKGREGASLTVIGDKAYLYGGLSTGIMKELYIYNLSKNRWKIPPVVGDVPRQGRSGHSAVAIKSSLWIFGGESEAYANATNKVCLNNILVFNTTLGQWNSVQARCVKRPIMPRRNHAACDYDQVMLVYGGVGQLGDYLNDIWVFNTDTKVWKEINVVEKKADEKGIAYHTICSVFQGKEILLKEKNQRRKVGMEGFYVFGGRNQKGDALNRLKLLRYDNGGMTWTYPSTKGLSPAARYGHSMVYYPEGGYLVIYGGRNDKLFQAQGSCCLNYLNVLSLSDLSWCTISTFGDMSIESRYAHTADVYKGQMLIFGGLNDYHFIDTTLSRLELDQEEVRRLQAIDIQRSNVKTASNQFTELLDKFVNDKDLDLTEKRKTRKLPKSMIYLSPSPKIKHTKKEF